MRGVTAPNLRNGCPICQRAITVPLTVVLRGMPFGLMRYMDYLGACLEPHRMRLYSHLPITGARAMTFLQVGAVLLSQFDFRLVAALTVHRRQGVVILCGSATHALQFILYFIQPEDSSRFSSSDSIELKRPRSSRA